MIDWDNAPEGADYEYRGFYYKVVNGVLFTYKVSGASGGGTVPFYWGESQYHHTLIEKMTARPESIPVYTQAMASHNIVPNVGMECQIRRDFGDDNEFYNGHLVHECNGVLWFVDDKYGGCLHSSNEVTIKPLTPPIELVDGKAYQFDHSSIGTAVGFYLKDKDLFDCAGTYYSIESECTNIKLLEVKV